MTNIIQTILEVVQLVSPQNKQVVIMNL